MSLSRACGGRGHKGMQGGCRPLNTSLSTCMVGAVYAEREGVRVHKKGHPATRPPTVPVVVPRDEATVAHRPQQGTTDDKVPAQRRAGGGGGQ
jgi:hypothetical protein